MDLNDEDRMLAAALRALAEDDVRVTASATVEERLRAEVRSIAARRRARILALAAAAVLLIAAAIPAWRMTIGRGETGARPVGSTAPPPPASPEVATAFLPLIYSNVPITNGQLVRLAVPRTALASFGLAPVELVDSASPGTVIADVIVGEDGLARAIRFVRPARRVAQQEQKP